MEQGSFRCHSQRTTCLDKISTPNKISVNRYIKMPSKSPAPRRSRSRRASAEDIQALRDEIKKLRDDFEKKNNENKNVIKKMAKEEKLNTVNNRLDELERNIATDNGLFGRRLNDIEEKLEKMENRFHFDPETTIIAQGLPETPGEDPERVADDLI